MNSKQASGLFVRYLILLVLGLSISGFYDLFNFLTVYPVTWILMIFSGGTRLFEGNLIFFKGFYAEIISACVAGAAYYLLLILNLSTPMKLQTRIKSVLFLMLTFLVLNIIRIVIFTILLTTGYEYFDLAHKAVWYFGSTILVVLIWFVNVWLFKIKDIPVYSDVKEIWEEIK
jgi:exosortase/archaeosortase family protein